MLKWLKKRILEPSSIIGLGLFAQAAMVLTKSNPMHTEVVSNVIEQAAAPLATGDYNSAITIGIAGLLGVLMKEKSEN